MRKLLYHFICFALTACLLLTGCTSSSRSSVSSTSDKKQGPLRDNTPNVLVPCADGTTIYNCEAASIDASNIAQGYVMASYHGENEKVKLQITTPEGVKYTYLLSGKGRLETFPLTGGSGNYQLTVFENVVDDQYAAILSQTLTVQIADEFKPFLYPNQYVNFTGDNQAVAKGCTLAKDAHSDLDVVTNIYNYVIQHISYDTQLAKNVSYGYLPDIDHTLASKRGICFDYAALMTAMLRSQKIPTKLEVGYSGDAYHAWI
ncbi:MAG: transglutaminase-like domain-containing protein, partial [Lachnospiraceae bacterium]